MLVFNMFKGDAVRNQFENCSGVIYKENSKQAKSLKETELHCLADWGPAEPTGNF